MVTRGQYDIKAVVEYEAEKSKGPMVISVCGPGMLSNAVMKTARELRSGVDFVEKG